MSNDSDTFGFSNLLSTLPAADRDALSQVPEDALNAWLEAKAEEFKKHRFVVLTMRNARAPVNRLSDDTLIDLFTLMTEQCLESCGSGHRRWPYLYLQDESCNTDEWRWMVYQGQVCRRWRTILRDMPAYWRAAAHNFLADYRSHIRPLAALLPRVAPLTLPPVNLDFAVEHKAWKALSPYAARISELRLYGVSDSVSFAVLQESITNEDWSNLESLRVEDMSDPQQRREPVGWRDEDLPRLKRLTIRPAYFCRATSVASRGSHPDPS
ncbi:hypothetical protein C8Q74DRAFT_1212872 [Fomes fomentarius]|nr:hypothetical protein C8Q74DRAFT_1212872 [Fomes fomentarius]